MLETVGTMGSMETTILPDSTARRISLRIWQLGLKKKDVAEALGYRPSFISDVSNGNKELGWADTAKLAKILHTTADYLLCLTDDPSLPDDKEQSPIYEHTESNQLATLADEQPDWLRRQLLAVAHAQVESIKEGTSPAQDMEQLREALRMAVLVLGEAEVNRLIRDTGRQVQPARSIVGSYRQMSLSRI